MKATKDKAEELIGDFIQMLPSNLDKIGISMSKQYDFAKVQSEYCAMVAKHSYEHGTIGYEYWSEVQKDINLL